MVIDSHQHFWKYNPTKDTWIDESMTVLKNDFLPEKLKNILKENDVNGCLAIQSEHSESSTKFLLDLANRHTFIKGVVGWVDLLSEKVEERLNYHSNDVFLKGIRHIVQGESEDFILRKDFQNGISKLSKYNLTYDLLIYPNQLPNTLKLISKFPNQIFIIDHIAKPFIKDKKTKTWKKNISELAKFPNVYCKISGMVTEANWNSWKHEDFTPYLDIVFNTFGLNRILFGSDWPVCLLAAEYREVKSVVEKYILKFSKEEQIKIMGLNAMKVYAINN